MKPAPLSIRKKRSSEAVRSSATSASDVLIGGRFQLEERLGGGAFGEVFKGRDVKSGMPVALKMELTKNGYRSHLSLEHKIYQRLNEAPLTVGIPRSLFCGDVGDYTIMVMDLLGPSLDDLLVMCRQKLSAKTVCMLAVQIIQRLQYMHTIGYLHRDIKPENFVMGLFDRAPVVYIIDVGLSKPWRDASGKPFPYAEGKSLTGTARYVSINTHQGVQQSRRDDLESVSYLLSYLARGHLPWQGLKNPKNDTRYEHIRDVKIATSPEKLTEGLPHQFADFVRYARKLRYEDEPDYDSCTKLFITALSDMNETYDFRYDWVVKYEDANSAARSEEAKSERQSSGVTNVKDSRHETMKAMGGSSMIMSSSYLPNPLDGFEDGRSDFSSVANCDFINEIESTYGVNNYN